MIRINLLPVRAARKKESIRFQLTVSGLITLLVVLVVAALYIKLNSEVNYLGDEIASAEVEMREIEKKIGELSKVKEQKRIVQSKLDVVERLEKGRTGPLKLLLQIEGAIPEKAWLTSIKDTGVIITIEGLATTEDMVAAFYRGLKGYKNLGKVELVVVQKGKQMDGRDTVAFTITIERKRS